MRGIIVGDNYFENPRITIARANGAHRVAGLLRDRGIEVEVIDFFNAWTLDELEKIIRHSQLDFIGLSFGLGELNDCTLRAGEFVALAKQVHPDIKIIAGGSTVLLSTIEGIDLHLKGFADGAIDDLVDYLTTGSYPNKETKYTNIGYIKNVVDCNNHYSKFDLSNLRTKYTANDFLLPTENLTLETGRGCIFKCKFCNFPLIGKNKNDYIRCKEDIKDEILHNYYTYGISQYSITDDTFNDNELKVNILYEISQEVDFDLSFMCYARIDLFHAKPGTLDKMMAMGTKGMFFGIESLNPETSKTIGKGFTGDKLKDYLKYIKDTYPKLHITGSFIVGLPQETVEQSEENINYVIDNNLVDAVPVFGLHIPRNTEGVDVSLFSKEWYNYGYTELSKEEIKEILQDPKYEPLNIKNIDDLMKHSILWRNEHMNVFDADLAARKIRLKSFNTTKLGGWGCFANTHSGVPLETLLQLKRSEWDWTRVRETAKNLIDDYKIKKIAAITT